MKREDLRAGADYAYSRRRGFDAFSRRVRLLHTEFYTPTKDGEGYVVAPVQKYRAGGWRTYSPAPVGLLIEFLDKDGTPNGTPELVSTTNLTMTWEVYQEQLDQARAQDRAAEARRKAKVAQREADIAVVERILAARPDLPRISLSRYSDSVPVPVAVLRELLERIETRP